MLTWVLHFRAAVALTIAVSMGMAFIQSRQWERIKGVKYLRAVLLGVAINGGVIAVVTVALNVGWLGVDDITTHLLFTLAQLFTAVPALLFALYMLGVINGASR